MKIHQLPNGARFEYKGEEYVKIGPMFGAGQNGQKLIPRSAVLKPIGEPEAAREVGKDSVSREQVLHALNTFYAECQTLVSDEQQATLESLRDRFLASLEAGRRALASQSRRL